MLIKINCIYNDRGTWCKHKSAKKSIFGIGARCCIESPTGTGECELKKERPKPTAPPPPPQPQVAKSTKPGKTSTAQTEYKMQYIDDLYKDDYACKFIAGSIHLGFLPNTSKYDNLGFSYQGQNYVSVFTFENAEAYFVEEYMGKNQYTELPKYIVFFKGNDDISYGLRFESREDRDDFIKHHLNEYSAFTEFIRTKCLCYN